MALLHLVQELVHLFGFGHERRLAGKRPDRCRLQSVAQKLEQVLGVDHARDVVDAGVKDRDARVAAFDDAVEHVAHGRLVRGGDDVDARHHDLAHGLLAELDDAGDHLAFALLQVGVPLDKVAQAILRVGWCDSVLDAHQPPYQLVERVQRQQHEEEDSHHELDGANKRQGNPFGSRHGDDAAEELGEQQDQQLDHAEDDGYPRRGRPPHVEVEPESGARRDAQGNGVDDQDGRERAGRLFEQP